MHFFHIKVLYHNKYTYMQITRERLEIQTCNKHRLSPFAESFLTSYCTLENSKWFLRSWGGLPEPPPWALTSRKTVGQYRVKSGNVENVGINNGFARRHRLPFKSSGVLAAILNSVVGQRRPTLDCPLCQVKTGRGQKCGTAFGIT